MKRVAVMGDDNVVTNVILAPEDYAVPEGGRYEILPANCPAGPGWISKGSGVFEAPEPGEAPPPTLTLEQQLLQMEEALAAQRAELDALIEIMLGGM